MDILSYLSFWVFSMIADSNSVTTKIEEIFKSKVDGERIDNVELKVIHNIISKILKDTKVLPKALLVKYFIILFYGSSDYAMVGSSMPILPS